MFRLTNKLAVSNLIKNRKLYYPFALAVLLAVTITYLFYSLSLNPNIGKIRGGETISMTLALGMVVVTIASGIIVLYANSFVMKNRSKELGVYGMLGLEKRHLISMVFKELLIFGSLTLTAGLGLGALFDSPSNGFLVVGHGGNDIGNCLNRRNCILHSNSQTCPLNHRKIIGLVTTSHHLTLIDS